MSKASSIIWQPDSIETTNVFRFMKRHGIATYDELIARSVADIRWFWRAALDDLGVEWANPYTQVLDDSQGFPWCRWFVGGTLNIVHNCLDRHIRDGFADKPAFFFESDDGKKCTVTYGEWNRQVNQVALFLLSQGIGKGDRIGLYMPMIAEMPAVLFAAFKIGAAVVPVFSGFGPHALAARLVDAECKVLFTADGSCRRGKAIDLKQLADEAVALAPCVRTVVVKRNVNTAISMQAGRDLWWEAAIAPLSGTLETQMVEAEHPCLIIYTSGTTGKPKGTVHTHAGCLAQMSKELGYHFDLKRDDRFFWVTDIGWMMGPWEIIGVSFFGATFGIFEGAPDYPQPDRLWQIIETHQVTHLGLSPTLVRLLRKAGEAWVDRYPLTSLRLMGSTGEAWDPESYMWCFDKIGKGRVPIMNISGGTEIIGCLLAPLPIKGLKPCTLQGPGLGMDVDVWNEAGQSVRGEVGYLVCKQPAPSMTKGFLNDPERYLDTYFSKWPAVWNHGDWAIVDDDGFWFLQGRSDDTIKVAGKRTGPAEIESALLEHPAVAEAAAIGVPHEVKGESVVAFVVLKSGTPETSDLTSAIADQVAALLGKTLRPEKVYLVTALPKTRSGKIVRGTIKKHHLGQAVGDLSSLESPEVLTLIPVKN